MTAINRIEQLEQQYISACITRMNLWVALGRVPPDQRAGVEERYLEAREAEQACKREFQRAVREAVNLFDEVA